MDTSERFEAEIAEHVMTVIRDDGEYRHLRFSRPNTRAMSFDLLTWPGHLCYTGDMGTYVFSRVRDMFEFFRSPKADWRDINLSYWAEKVLASDRDGIKEFSDEIFAQNVWEALNESLDGLLSHDLTPEQVAQIREDVELDVINEAECNGESAGIRAAMDFQYESVDLFTDFWEVDSSTYTHRYTWCCHAIVWGIAQYDAAKTEAVPA